MDGHETLSLHLGDRLSCCGLESLGIAWLPEKGQWLSNKRLLHQDSCDHGSMLTRTQFTVPEGPHVVYGPTKVTSWKTGLQHGGQVLPQKVLFLF